jgi:hypothetical protein
VPARQALRPPAARHALIALAAAAFVGTQLVAPPPAPASPRWRPNVRAAARWAAHRRGAVSFAVRTPYGAWGRHRRRTYPSASVVKAMLLVAYLHRRDVRHRRLKRSERRLLGPMIRRSDNHAASAIYARTGDGRLRALARRAHMRRFTPGGPVWGASRIDAADQARFFLHIDRLMPRRHRAYGMWLLAHVIRAQRWGVARERPPGWRLYFKGGWGTGTGVTDHQVALLTRGGRRVSLAMLTYGSGSHVYGTRTLRGLARRLLRGL